MSHVPKGFASCFMLSFHSVNLKTLSGMKNSPTMFCQYSSDSI